LFPPTFYQYYNYLLNTLIQPANYILNNENAEAPYLNDFVYSFISILDPVFTAAIAGLRTENLDYGVYVTGHSQGALIAELIAAHYPEVSGAVTFESPGSAEIVRRNPQYFAVPNPNIKVFLAAPNIVNTSGSQAGVIHRVYVPYAEHDWSWSHFCLSVLGSTGRVVGYTAAAAAGVTTAGAAVPLTIAAAGALGAFGSGGFSVFSFLVGPRFLRQHSMRNISQYLSNPVRAVQRMQSWPTFPQLLNSLSVLVRTFLPFPRHAPGVRNIFDENAMVDDQIALLRGYLPSPNNF
jgi:pimeloyl-ACP methyl ester carboxylesterase